MTTKNNLALICEKYDVHDLYSFGSRAMEALDFVNERVKQLAPSKSDLDLGVRFAIGREIRIATLVRLTTELEDFFGIAKVDLISLSDASPFLALDIIRGELLYAKDMDEQSRFELYVLARAGDLQFYEIQRRKNLLSGVTR